MENYFVELNNINVNDKVEKKNGLSYVSWAFAWGELKKHFPKSFYTVYENENGWPYFTDGRTCWVKTGVTVVQSEVVRDPTDGNLYGEDFGRLEHIEYLPIMDFKNNSIPLERVTSFDVNKAIQRSLTKAVARHGLGLYIYAGEDLPEDAKESYEATTTPAVVTAKAPAVVTAKAPDTTTTAPDTTTTAPDTTTTKKKPNPIRAEFVELCKSFPDKLNLTELAKEYKLNNDAPDENFIKAINYAKFCLRVESSDVETGYPEEV
jgi:hypothetical protein